MEELKVKQRLALLSENLRMAKDLCQLPEEFDHAEGTNELLKVHYGIDKKELGTFKQWFQKGLVVKKGEKGFPIWTAPLKGHKKVEAENGEKVESDKTYKFFSVCFVFTNDQVQPRGTVV